MAEFAESRMQDMVPEIEELERIELLSSSEIKTLLQKRRDFEYKIAKSKKEKKDFVNYVLFDCKLLDLLRLRRDKLGMHEKKSAIEFTMCRRIIKLLKLMTLMWPASQDLWKLRISFLKSRGLKEEVTSSYVEQARFFGNQESVWVTWADWEMSHNANFHKARDILLSKAPLYHPNSLVLLREYFRLELLYLEHLRKKSEISNLEVLSEVIAENRDKVMDCAVPKTIYEDALNRFPKAEISIELYKVCESFPFAHELRETIFSNLLKNFPREASTWQLKAKRQLTMEENKEGADKKISLKPNEKLEHLLTIYNNAMEVIGHSFLPIYLEELTCQLFQTWGIDSLSETITEKLIELCNQYTKYLSSYHFLLWYCVTNISENESKNIISIAESNHPGNLYIKLLHLKQLLADCTNDKLKAKCFEGFNDSFRGNIGIEAWLYYIQSLQGKGTKLSAYERGANHINSEIATSMRTEYIKHIFHKKGIKSARKLYKEYKYAPPLSSKIHAIYLLKEMKSRQRSSSEIRQAFETAILQFGPEQTGVWLSYVYFERKYGDSAKASYLLGEARDRLHPKKLKEFIDLQFIFDGQMESLPGMTPSRKNNSRIFVTSSDKRANEIRIDEEIYISTNTCKILDEEPLLTYTGVKSKRDFFTELEKLKKRSAGMVEGVCDDNLAWEQVLSYILDDDVSLSIKEVKSSTLPNDITELKSPFEDISKRKKWQSKYNVEPPSENLKIEISSNALKDKDEISELLKKSETLQPDFMNKKQLVPYFLSQRVKKTMRKAKAKNPVDAGPGWFHMKAPKITPEIDRDMKILKMRSVLDPKSHYKRNDMKDTPKFFQMGKIMDAPQDFYSSRVPNKMRKNTIAEEIMNDEKTIMYQKRKHQEIVGESQKRRRVFKTAKKNDMKKSKQNKFEKRKEKRGLSAKKKT